MSISINATGTFFWGDPVHFILSSSSSACLCSNLWIQLAKTQLRNKRSWADIIIQIYNSLTKTANSLTIFHPYVFKAGRKIVFTLYQLTNQTKDISKDIQNDFQSTNSKVHYRLFLYVKYRISRIQFFKFQDSWRLEILSKLSLFGLDSKVALTCTQLFSTDFSKFYHTIAILKEKVNIFKPQISGE